LSRTGVKLDKKSIEVTYQIVKKKYADKNHYIDMLGIEKDSKQPGTPEFSKDIYNKFSGLFTAIQNNPNDNIVKWTPNNAKSTRGIVIFEYEYGNGGVMTVIDLPGIENFSSREITGYLKNAQGLEVNNNMNIGSATLTQTIKKEKNKKKDINKVSLLVGAKTNGGRAEISRKIYSGETTLDESKVTFMNLETLLNLQAESAWINTFTKADGAIASFLERRQQGKTIQALPYIDETKNGAVVYFTDYLTKRENSFSGKKSKFIMVATAFNPNAATSTNIYINTIKSNGAKQTLEFSNKFASTSGVDSSGGSEGNKPMTTAKMSNLMQKILDASREEEEDTKVGEQKKA
jgi:hypothetical protein